MDISVWVAPILSLVGALGGGVLGTRWSTKTWKRDQKKEACYDLLRQFQPMGHTFGKLAAAHQQKDPDRIREAQGDFLRVYANYMNAKVVIELVGSIELVQVERKLNHAIMHAYAEIEAAGLNGAAKTLVEFAETNQVIVDACRRELGFEPVVLKKPKD